MNNNLKTIYVPIGDLQPAVYNPRQMSDKQAADLEQSIIRFGLVDPLIVNRHPERMNIVIGGHQRLLIAKRLGFEKVPVVYVDLDEQQEKELNLRLNKNLGDWDLEALAQFDPSLLSMVGWTDEELEDIFKPPDEEKTNDIPQYDDSKEDEVPDLPAEPQSKPGDIYQLGRHRLLCGDSTNPADVMRLMQGKKARMVFTSPPYSDLREYHIGEFSWDKLMAGVFGNIVSQVAEENTHILVNLGLAHKNRAVEMYWNGWFSFMADHGYPLFGWYVWDKGCGMPGEWNGRLGPAHEFVFHFNKKCGPANKWIETQYADMDPERLEATKKSSRYRQKDGSLKPAESPDKYGQPFKIPDSVIRISRAVTAGTILVAHPAVYPVALPEFGCKTWTQENDLVFEPFGGSGTTLVACEKTNRCCYLMEIDPVYVDLILARWSRFTGTDAVKVNA
ncbi:MAG: DNA modification methylase [bacterium]